MAVNLIKLVEQFVESTDNDLNIFETFIESLRFYSKTHLQACLELRHFLEQQFEAYQATQLPPPPRMQLIHILLIQHGLLRSNVQIEMLYQNLIAKTLANTDPFIIYCYAKFITEHNPILALQTVNQSVQDHPLLKLVTIDIINVIRTKEVNLNSLVDLFLDEKNNNIEFILFEKIYGRFFSRQTTDYELASLARYLNNLAKEYNDKKQKLPQRYYVIQMLLVQRGVIFTLDGLKLAFPVNVIIQNYRKNPELYQTIFFKLLPNDIKKAILANKSGSESHHNEIKKAYERLLDQFSDELDLFLVFCYANFCYPYNFAQAKKIIAEKDPENLLLLVAEEFSEKPADVKSNAIIIDIAQQSYETVLVALLENAYRDGSLLAARTLYNAIKSHDIDIPQSMLSKSANSYFAKLLQGWLANTPHKDDKTHNTLVASLESELAKQKFLVVLAKLISQQITLSEKAGLQSIILADAYLRLAFIYEALDPDVIRRFELVYVDFINEDTTPNDANAKIIEKNSTPINAELVQKSITIEATARALYEYGKLILASIDSKYSAKQDNKTQTEADNVAIIFRRALMLAPGNITILLALQKLAKDYPSQVTKFAFALSAVTDDFSLTTAPLVALERLSGLIISDPDEFLNYLYRDESLLTLQSRQLKKPATHKSKSLRRNRNSSLILSIADESMYYEFLFFVLARMQILVNRTYQLTHSVHYLLIKNMFQVAQLTLADTYLNALNKATVTISKTTTSEIKPYNSPITIFIELLIKFTSRIKPIADSPRQDDANKSILLQLFYTLLSFAFNHLEKIHGNHFTLKNRTAFIKNIKGEEYDLIEFIEKAYLQKPIKASQKEHAVTAKRLLRELVFLLKQIRSYREYKDHDKYLKTLELLEKQFTQIKALKPRTSIIDKILICKINSSIEKMLQRRNMVSFSLQEIPASPRQQNASSLAEGESTEMQIMQSKPIQALTLDLSFLHDTKKTNFGNAETPSPRLFGSAPASPKTGGAIPLVASYDELKVVATSSQTSSPLSSDRKQI